MMQRTIAASWLRGLVDMFAAEGLDKIGLLRECGLQPRDLEDAERRFPATVTTRLWELAIARHPKPTLGLERQLCDRYGGMHLVGYAMMACPTLLEGLRLMQRYLAVVSEATVFDMQKDELGYWLYVGLQGEAQPPRQRAEFALLTVLMLCTWFTRSNIQPLAVEMIYPEPADARPHSAAFLTDVHFGQPHNRMLLRHEDLQRTLPTHDPVVAALHERYLQQQLQKLGHTSTRYRVFTEIVRRLKNGEPRRAEIAASIHVSERTLQRRLREENISFQELLNDARRELAQQYLADPRLSLTEVADLLGFGDQSNFFRASKRWFGVSPGQYRSRFESA